MLHYGRFCWHDQNTNDIEGSCEFYSQLFGWHVDRSPQPNNYRRLSSGDREFGGLFPWPPEVTDMRTYWTGYILVEDVAETARRARELGGHAPFDSMPIPGIGTIGFIFDPTGAAVTTFTPVAAIDDWPLGPGGTGGTVPWNELITTDLATSVAFHCELFGWSVDQAVVDTGGYVIARRGDVAAAGIFSFPSAPPVSAWITYFDTSDIHDSVARAESLGGTVLHPVTDVPSVGLTAWVNDPEGATFGLMQPENGWFERLNNKGQESRE